MRPSLHLLPVLLAAALSATAVAQPGPGPGPRQGQGFRFNQDNTPGWALMTQEERASHREKMMSMKSVDECKAYMDEHHALMEERAKEKGKNLPGPRNNACDRMKSRGLIK
jgi:hypothetical protein